MRSEHGFLGRLRQHLHFIDDAILRDAHALPGQRR